MKIYTRSGDDGTTGLYGGARGPKLAARIEAYGTVDELNSMLGLARSHLAASALDPALGRVQSELFTLGAELASPGATTSSGAIGIEHVSTLEHEIDGWDAKLEPLHSFILPGGTPAAAALHAARTICRRAERRVLTLGVGEPIPEQAVAYLNRLSDHLFTAARVANREAGVSDVPWVQS